MRKIIMPSVEAVIERMHNEFGSAHYITTDEKEAVEYTLDYAAKHYIDTSALPENTTCVGCALEKVSHMRDDCLGCSRLNNHRVDNYRKA
jgi:hypothetical protein